MTLSASNANTAEGEGVRRGLCSNLRCSRSVAFRNERRHLIFLSVLAGVVFFGCGLLGTTSLYSAPASQDTPGSFSASSAAATQPVAGSQQQQQQQFAAVAAAGAEGSSSSGGGDGSSGETQEEPELKVHVFNSYTKGNPLDLYPWEHVSEPYKPSTMEVLDRPPSGDNLEYR